MRNKKRFATKVLTVVLAVMVTFTAFPMESYAATMNYNSWLETVRNTAHEIEKARFGFAKGGCSRGNFNSAKKLSSGRKLCNCADFISWSLQRAGLLKGSKRFYVKGKTVHGSATRVIKGKNFQIIKISGKPRASVLTKKGIIKPGDLVSQADGSGHHGQIYAGKDSKGKDIWYAIGKTYQTVNGRYRASRILSTQYDHRSHHNNPRVAMIIRIKGLTYDSKFKITSSATGGKITSTASVKWRGKKTFKYSANKGYKLSKVLVDGKAVSKSKYGKSYTFSNVIKKHSIKVVYARVQYKVNTVLENCTITSDRNANGNPVAYYDLNTNITITPEDGYKIDRVVLNGKDVILEGGNSVVISGATAAQKLEIYCVPDDSASTGQEGTDQGETDQTGTEQGGDNGDGTPAQTEPQTGTGNQTAEPAAGADSQTVDSDKGNASAEDPQAAEGAAESGAAASNGQQAGEAA